MRKILCLLLTLAMLLCVGCAATPAATDAPAAMDDPVETDTPLSDEGLKTYTAVSSGYNGDMTVEVDIEGDVIKDIRIVEDHESSPVRKRSADAMIGRILAAQTPVVDSMTAATFTSYAIKSAVADALKQAGKDVGTISFNNEMATDAPTAVADEEVSLVIVGAGPAGQSAAIAAVEAGLPAEKVLVLEKLDITGGNGKFDMVLFNHAGSKAQEVAGIEDSAEKLYEDRKAGGAWDSDARLKAEAEITVTMDEWYRGMGIELNYVYDTRSHLAEKNAYAGEELLDGVEGRVKELGIPVRTGNKVTDLIMEDGRLTGVKVLNISANETYNVRADAVVIATGGFCQNPELLAKYTAEGTSKLRSSNQIGATGDLVPAFESNGFQLGHMDKTTVFSFMISKGRELTGERVAPQSYDYVQVNVNGERFTNELVSYGLPRAIDVMNQPDGKSFMIFDQELKDFSFRLGKHADAGLLERADTLEELADKLGVNAEGLLKTIEAFNKAAEEGAEDALRGKAPTRPICVTGPFYGMQIESAIHMTKGGVVCDENARCLDNDGNVIPGAFAAGEVTDTSANFSAAFVFGRIAGMQAAAEILAK